MKFIVAFTPVTGGDTICQNVVANSSDMVARWLLNQGVINFNIVPVDKIYPKPVYLSPMYEPEVVATSHLARVEIAAEDYNVGGKEVDGIHYFTFDEGIAIQEELKDTGWRLPTRSEWVLICEEFGQKDSQLDTETLYKNLNMGYTGYYSYSDGKMYRRTTYGTWWSATRSSATDAYNLFTHTSYVYPQYSDYRGYGFALRLVRDIDWGKGGNS